MCVCIYIYIYIYVCSIHTLISLSLYIYIYICIHIHTHMLLHVIIVFCDLMVCCVYVWLDCCLVCFTPNTTRWGTHGFCSDVRQRDVHRHRSLGRSRDLGPSWGTRGFRVHTKRGPGKGRRGRPPPRG